MEVTIFEAIGLPEGAIISVRAGNTRRQAPVPLAGPLRFPNLPFNAKQFKVDVMQTLGSSKVEINASKELESYSVGVDVGNLQQARVGFTVREQPSLCGKRACELKQVDKNPESLHEEPGPVPLPPEKARAVMDSRSYAREHNIPNLVQELLQHVLREKPDAPFLVMSEYFKRKGQEMGEKPENTKILPCSGNQHSTNTGAVTGGIWAEVTESQPPMPTDAASIAASQALMMASEQTLKTQLRTLEKRPSYEGEYYIPNVPDEEPCAHIIQKAEFDTLNPLREQEVYNAEPGPPVPLPKAFLDGTAPPGARVPPAEKALPGEFCCPPLPPFSAGSYAVPMEKAVPGQIHPDSSFNKALPLSRDLDAGSSPTKAIPPPSSRLPSAPMSRDGDPERSRLEAEHLALQAERSSLLRELELLALQQNPQIQPRK